MIENRAETSSAVKTGLKRKEARPFRPGI